MKPPRVWFTCGEMIVAVFLYIFFVARCFFLVYVASKDKEDMLSFDLHSSWWFGRKMDDSDHEWRFWVDFYSHHLSWFVGHGLMGLLINSQFQEARVYFNIFYSILALGSMFSLKQLTFLVSNACLVYLCVVLFRSKTFVWVISLTILGLLNLKSAEPLIISLCYPDPLGYKYVMLVYTMTAGSIRLISCGIDLCDQYYSTQRMDPFYKVLIYNIYLPTFISGPFVSYRKFITNITQKQAALTWVRVKAVLWELSVLLFWWMCMEISLHYFYCTALQQEEYFLISADNWTLFSICLVQVALFNVKYMVLYGLPIMLGQIDGIDMPAKPVCLLIQHSASSIWRSFDVGLYKFIRRYIYIPIGGSKFGLSHQVLTSFVCFVFIGFWHGGEMYLFIWVLTNFLANLLEKLHAEILKSPQWKALELQMGEAALLRLQVLLMAPIRVISLWSMFLFLGGRNVGFNLYKKILKNSGAETRVYVIVLAYTALVALQSIENGAVMAMYKQKFGVLPLDMKKHKNNHSVTVS